MLVTPPNTHRILPGTTRAMGARCDRYAVSGRGSTHHARPRAARRRRDLDFLGDARCPRRSRSSTVSRSARASPGYVGGKWQSAGFAACARDLRARPRVLQALECRRVAFIEAPVRRNPVQFPCDFPLKVMGRRSDDFRSLVVGIVQKHVGTVDVANDRRALEQATTKYLSLTYFRAIRN